MAYALSSSCWGLSRVLNGAPIVPVIRIRWGRDGLHGVKVDSNSERRTVGADGGRDSGGDGRCAEQNSAQFVRSKSGSSSNAVLGVSNAQVVT